LPMSPPDKAGLFYALRRRWIKMENQKRRPQLDAEIKACIAEESPISGYRACQLIRAPKATVVWHLKRMVRKGELDAKQGPRTTITYSLPGHEPEKAKPALEAVFDPSLNRYVQPGQPRSIERR